MDDWLGSWAFAPLPLARVDFSVGSGVASIILVSSSSAAACERKDLPSPRTGELAGSKPETSGDAMARMRSSCDAGAELLALVGTLDSADYCREMRSGLVEGRGFVVKGWLLSVVLRLQNYWAVGG